MMGSTTTRRDTLFIWGGTLAKNENLVWQFKGCWIGVEAPDARTAPTPNPQAFAAASDMTFNVVSKLPVMMNDMKIKEDDTSFSSAYFSYDMTGGESHSIRMGFAKEERRDEQNY